MGDKPKVLCEKPKLPTLWLDTSVIIKLTKVERGEKLQQVEVDRLTKLRTLVQELVPAGKLIFPQSDQEEEYVAKRFDPEIHRDFLGLSLGISMKHRQASSIGRLKSAWMPTSRTRTRSRCGLIRFSTTILLSNWRKRENAT
jgi:hypothetical protein